VLWGEVQHPFSLLNLHPTLEILLLVAGTFIMELTQIEISIMLNYSLVLGLLEQLMVI
jgi:hypothetical protein